MWCIFSGQSVHSAAVPACCSFLDVTAGVSDRQSHLRTRRQWVDKTGTRSPYFDANYHVLNQEFQENVLSIGQRKTFTLEMKSVFWSLNKVCESRNSV